MTGLEVIRTTLLIIGGSAAVLVAADLLLRLL